MCVQSPSVVSVSVEWNRVRCVRARRRFYFLSLLPARERERPSREARRAAARRLLFIPADYQSDAARAPRVPGEYQGVQVRKL